MPIIFKYFSQTRLLFSISSPCNQNIELDLIDIYQCPQLNSKSFLPKHLQPIPSSLTWHFAFHLMVNPVLHKTLESAWFSPFTDMISVSADSAGTTAKIHLNYNHCSAPWLSWSKPRARLFQIITGASFRPRSRTVDSQVSRGML